MGYDDDYDDEEFGGPYDTYYNDEEYEDDYLDWHEDDPECDEYWAAQPEPLTIRERLGILVYRLRHPGQWWYWERRTLYLRFYCTCGRLRAIGNHDGCIPF